MSLTQDHMDNSRSMEGKCKLCVRSILNISYDGELFKVLTLHKDCLWPEIVL